MRMLHPFDGESIALPVRVVRVGTKPHDYTRNRLVSAIAEIQLSPTCTIEVDLTGTEPEHIGTVIEPETEFVSRELMLVGGYDEDLLHDKPVGIKAVWFDNPDEQRIGKTLFFVDDVPPGIHMHKWNGVWSDEDPRMLRMDVQWLSGHLLSDEWWAYKLMLLGDGMPLYGIVGVRARDVDDIYGGSQSRLFAVTRYTCGSVRLDKVLVGGTYYTVKLDDTPESDSGA